MTLSIAKYALIVASASLFVACSKSPESTIDSFYHALEKGEVVEAKSYVSQQIVALMGDAKLSSALVKEAEKIKTCGGIKNIEKKLEGQGEIQSGTTVVTFGGKCPPRSEKAKLVKEDGKWKITATK